MKKVEKELKAKVSYLEPSVISDFEIGLTQFAINDYDLIMAIGYQAADACRKVANNFKNKQFVLFDDIVDSGNVISVTFREEEGSFLAGFLASAISKTSTIGFIGGSDASVITRFRDGYTQGTESFNRSIKVRTATIGGANPFNDPVKAKDLSLSMISFGADILFHAAGASGLGLINAAKDERIFAIGVDSDQDLEAPGTILTSVVKNLEDAIFNLSKDRLENKLKSELLSLGLKENGVGLVPFKPHIVNKIPQKVIKQLEDIKQKIIKKEILIKRSIN
jgi:basic membrane protein A